LPAAPSDDDLQACLQQTGDYVTRGKTLLYVIGLANSCNKRLRCEIFANVTGSRGSVTGHTVMTLGAAGSGAAAKQTYSMHVKAAGGISQVSRECKVL
jgi:ribulose kinase